MKSAGEIRREIKQANIDRKIIENRQAVERGEKTVEEVISEGEEGQEKS